MHDTGPDEHETIHRYQVQLTWAGSTGVGYDRYDRNHVLSANPSPDRPTGTVVPMSSAPAFRGDPTLLDPEQLIVMAAASCQLLSFLAVAARARIDVVSYADDPVGSMPTTERPVRLSEIALRPHIAVALDADLTEDRRRALDARLRHLVGVAHRECYVANSLITDITIEPTFSFIARTA